MKADWVPIELARFNRHNRLTLEWSWHAMRIISITLLALLCASCSASSDRSESELSRKIVRTMEAYRETRGFTDVSGELCDGLTQADLESSVSELAPLGKEFRLIKDGLGVWPDGANLARFSQNGAQFMSTQELWVWVKEDADYCFAKLEHRFSFSF